jgi:gas vesicle protein
MNDLRDYVGDYIPDYYRNDSSTFLIGVAAGFALGALAMFIFDPDQGRRRRALARDKMVHYGRRAGDMVSGAAKDLSNRAYGVAAETRGAVRDAIGSEQPETPKQPF